MRYIDAYKLIAEIERLYGIARNASYNGEVEGEMTAYDKILNIITSLQQEQPEVDLEKFDKEVTKIWGRCAADPNDSLACFHIETFNEIARHFYELGKNAKK